MFSHASMRSLNFFEFIWFLASVQFVFGIYGKVDKVKLGWMQEDIERLEQKQVSLQNVINQLKRALKMDEKLRELETTTEVREREPTVAEPYCANATSKGQLHSKCNGSTDCLVSNSVCVDGCCQCPPPFYREDYCGFCEMIPKQLGSPCLDHLECAREIFRSVCDLGRCSCSSLYKMYCNKHGCQCVNKELWDDCKEDAECSVSVANSKCRKAKCQCDYEQHYFPTKCGRCEKKFK